MSIKINNKTIAGPYGKPSSYHPPLLSCMWSDHLINDIQFLRADTFSWQDGNVYKASYDKLSEEYQLAIIPEETEDNITFKRSTNGFKIADASQEQAILDKYNTYGVAWYYILDEINTRFKLPRTKYNFKGLRTGVGNDIYESLPNINAEVNIGAGTGFPTNSSYSGAFKPNTTTRSNAISSQSSASTGLAFDASKSSPVYQDDAPVQERGTEMYLYFYVGEYTQTAIEQTAGITTELVNNKVDIDANNFSTQGKSFISGLGCPSSRYIDLTVGASLTVYTAPANGWFSVDSWTNGNFIYLNLIKNNLRSISIRSGEIDMECKLFVKEGDRVELVYDGAWLPHSWQRHPFTFIYAEGEI